MKKLNIKLALAALSTAIITGCYTTNPTPFPKSTTAVLVGLGYKCDKKELQKKGSDLDIATMFESIRYCYRDEMQNYSNGDSHGISYTDFVYTPNCNYRILQDKDATIQNVKTAINLALKDDLAIIYFSCKTTQIPSTNDVEEVDGLDECLRLYDGLLTDNEIWELLQDARGRVFIMFDTSNSGGMLRSNNSNQTDSLLFDLYDEIIKEQEDRKPLSLVCWAACLDNETLKERSIGSKMTNVFYFKYADWSLSYDDVFNKIYKSLENKQHINKTVIGEDFSNLSMFR